MQARREKKLLKSTLGELCRSLISGTGDSQRDSRESIRASHSQLKPLLSVVAHQADSPESLEFPIRANHPIRANRANRFAPLRS